MRHELDSRDLGPRTDAMKHAIETCVHCGFCLPTCPTYDVLGLEADSPRGRIVLMKGVLEGTLTADDASQHLDRCLGCLSCETSCPSGVPYGELLTSYRAEAPSRDARGLGQRLQAWIASSTLPHPALLRPLMILGRVAKRFGRLNPRLLRPMLELVPETLPEAPSLKPIYRASGSKRGEVAMHVGCVQRVMSPSITEAAIRVLNRNGFDVHILTQPSCCGALDWHIGNAKPAQRLAKRFIDHVPQGMTLVTTAAGCASTIREYPLVLAGTDDAGQSQGKDLAARTIDIAEFLAQHDVAPAPPVPPIRIAYHDACHLAHAQRVKASPRKLLSAIAGVELLEIPDGHFCCGSAGLYNVQQPELAAELGRRKAASIQQTRPDVVALGNIGCQVQIDRYLKEMGSDIPVLHTVEILDRAYNQQPIHG